MMAMAMPLYSSAVASVVLAVSVVLHIIHILYTGQTKGILRIVSLFSVDAYILAIKDAHLALSKVQLHACISN